MKLKIFSLLIAASLLLTTQSCEDIIDVKLHSVEPQLVIEGVVRMDAPAEVYITKTKDFNDNTPYTPITDAIVTISDNKGNTEILTGNTEGRFIANSIMGTEQSTYYLSVVYDEVEYTATTYMPPKVDIDSLTLWKFPLADFHEPMVHFKDPLGEENQYYRFKISVNGEYPRLIENIVSTEFMDGNVIHYPLFVRYKGGNDDDPIEWGDEIGIEMRCLDKDTYTYFKTLDDVENALANPTGNISGGALGYFGAYSFSNMSIRAEWD